MFLLSLIFATFIYMTAYLSEISFCTTTISFKDSFILARLTFMCIIFFKFVVHLKNIINVKKKIPKELGKKIFLSLLSFSVSVTYFQIFYLLFCMIDFYFVEKISNDVSKSEINNPSMHHVFNKVYPTVVYAEGKYLYLEDGRIVFDGASGAAVASIGYGNLTVIEAIYQKYLQGVHYIASAF